MRVPVSLAEGFGAPFEKLISEFATERGLLPEVSAVNSVRFLARSVIPHIRKLSTLFNRIDRDDPTCRDDQGKGLDPYWKESTNPANLRLAYFLYFMPSNLFRVSAIWAELSRLGFKWRAGDTLRGLELGAGPAAGACGIAAGEFHASLGLPRKGNWALIEQDKAMLELGAAWSQRYFSSLTDGDRATDWATRTFHRKISLAEGLLPKAAPRFNLWVMSFFLNEFTESPMRIAQALAESWERHLDEEGVVIMSEPALKLQSRRLLEVRAALLELQAKGKLSSDFKILLPCMGHQSCGALALDGDWCHDEVMWWRPPYFRVIDRLAELDRKSLPFSYLVIVRSKRSREELLPALATSASDARYRLVSPSHKEGREIEFFVCGQEGKRRARYKPEAGSDPEENPDRGDILLGVEIRGEANASRIERFEKLK